MQVVRAFRYRLYPSDEQVTRLRRWEGALRWLWNLAHEQRLTGLARLRSERIFCSAEGQMKELTELRAQLDWLDDVPCDVAQATLTTLDVAWRRCFQKLAGRPHFKAKDHDAMGLCEGHKKAWRLEVRQGREVLVFPKLGAIPVVVHRPLEGKRTSATIERDGDQWFVTISCRLEVPDHVPAPAGEVVGIDRGVANLVADSTGHLEPRPAFLDEGAHTIARASQNLSRKKKGSKNRQKAREKLAAAYRKVRRQREHTLNVLAKRYAKNHRVVVVEDLTIGNLVRSASGTVESPGTNVAQKRGLNRAILQMGWGQFVRLLEQKAPTFGSRVVRVAAAYSSQECAECGHIEAANRPDQARFACQRCGHRDHADRNAARVLVKRYEESTRRAGGGEVCGGDATRRPEKQKRRSVRTTAPSPNARAQSPVVHDGDGLPARMMSVRLAVDALTVERDGRPVVRGVSLHVPGGQILGVFGPSGAGKSTLFRALAGELPASGSVQLDGQRLDRWPVWRRARAGLGYVPQGSSVLLDLTVRDNLLTFARLADRGEDPDTWATRVGLADRRDVRAGSLSGGERRRLELARALLPGPAVLLCDEPFAGLNPASIDAVADLLRQAAAQGTAVVLTDHHLDEALAVSDHALLLLDGAIELAAPAPAFADHPLVRERYVGRGRA